MTLALGTSEPFPETERADRILARRSGLAGAIERFEQWAADPDSPVRAVKHQPARPGQYIDFPEGLPPAIQIGRAHV